MRGNTSVEREASRLINYGYRKISNTHQMVARIDRKDWAMYMAEKHAPWDPTGEGIEWVTALGTSARDHYRRCYSSDRLSLIYNVFKLMPSSGFNDVGYRPKKGDTKVTKNEPTNAYDVKDKWKIHSINVVTGNAHSTKFQKFYDSFEEALERCKEIVKRDGDVQMVILKCTHVVQAMCPPVEVIDLDKMEHSDA